MPRCRHEFRKTWIRPVRSRHRMTDSSPIEDTRKSPGLGIWLSWPMKSHAREDLVLLPAVDLLVHEDLPADDALVDVDEAVEAVQHRGPPAFRRRAER